MVLGGMDRLLRVPSPGASRVMHCPYTFDEGARDFSYQKKKSMHTCAFNFYI
jgi:hypothetical protein